MPGETLGKIGETEYRAWAMTAVEARLANAVPLGLAEQVVFPEVDADKIHHTQGMDITVVTSTDSDDQARELLRGLGLPFRAPNSKKAS